MRTALILISLAAVMSLALPAVGQEVIPPEDQDFIEPEAEEPGKKPGRAKPRTSSSEEHTVVSGDTLWDLCGRYLNNPWYWPRVWSYNPEISNPHWIFPGQLVRFYPGGEGPGQIDIISRDMEVPMPEDIALDDESIPAEDLVEMSGRIVSAKPMQAIRLLRDSFVTREEIEEMGVIRASREEVQYLSERDTIYIDFKNLGAVAVGQSLSLYRTLGEIHHPVTGDLIGHQTQVLGVAQVINIAETSAVAVIGTSNQPIVRGDRVGPMADRLAREVAPRANEVELRGYIVGAAVPMLTQLGEHHLVFIDQGTEQGVQEGNLFDVVRRGDGLFMPGEGKQEHTWDKSMPAEIYGRVMVVDARPNASTGLVMSSLRELRVGDRVMMSLR